MNPILKTAWLGAMIFAASAQADNLGGSSKILCSILNVSECVSGGPCESAQPADLNIPRFIEIDAKAGKLTTTAASGEDRETRVNETSRSDGRLLMQGTETGRAYSLLIEESSGQASFASVTDGRAVIVFAACTPR